MVQENSELYSLLPAASQRSDQMAQLEDNPIDSEEVVLRSQKIHRAKRSRLDKLYRICRTRRCYSKILLATIIVSLIFYFISFSLSLTWSIFRHVCRKNLAEEDFKLVSVEWFTNSSHHAYNYIRPKKFTTLLEPRDICRSNIFLLIVVYSNIDSFPARQNIRKSWGNTTDFNYGKFSKLHSDFHGKYLEPPLKRLKEYEKYITGPLSYSGIDQFNITTPPPIIPMRVVFFMGRRSRKSFVDTEEMQHLRIESNKYNDIILEDFIDNHKNLTIKSVMMLKWLMSRCLSTCAFVLKCHDDVFVNVPNILQYLLGGTIPLYKDTLQVYNNNVSSSQMLNNTHRFQLTRNVLMGHLLKGNQTNSDALSRSFVPFQPFPINHTYPSYLAGSSYLMSSDVVQMLFSAAVWTRLIHAEDIFITGLCTKPWQHLKPQHNPLFGVRFSHTPCLLKASITQHRIKNDDLLQFYKLVNDDGIKCEAPNQLMLIKDLTERTTKIA